MGGNLNDSSGNGNNIVFNNATATSDRFGNANSAYHFSGSSYMRVSNSVTLNPSQITMMAVVKFNGFYTGAAYGNEIFMKGPSDQSQGIYGLRAHPQSYDETAPIDTSTEIFIEFYGDYASVYVLDSSTLIRSGDWNIVVYTYDGYQANLYINGHLKNSKWMAFETYVNDNDLYIGKTENATYPYYFTGDIDEIRIYDKALTPQLVQGFNFLTK